MLVCLGELVWAFFFLCILRIENEEVIRKQNEKFIKIKRSDNEFERNSKRCRYLG
jgi:hypothetical protein